ncbi:MAG: Cna domain protein [Edaphobacter sp.]|nr:Cna domain protein [Edaphobacter sp.]
MLKKFSLRFCLGLSLLILLNASSLAQQSTGAINGTVLDSTGAVISGASIVISNVATSIEREVTSNASGVYVFPNIPPGTYTMSARKNSFATTNETGIVLQVNQTITIDFRLKSGAQTETVTVDAAAAQLETSTAELGTVIGHQTVSDLPLNGRQFTQLLTLTPGASRANTSQNANGGQASALGGAYFPAMHGASNRSNYFMLDGINDNEDVFSTFAVSPIADDIQEFKVQSHNDQAQFGGVTGGIINVVTKSGTNRLHGAIWEFNRNAVLGAANPITFSKLPLNQNQYGLNLGGPVLIPHVYNGRGKTFFFGSYEAFRLTTNSASSVKLTGTPAELGGDFSAVKAQLYDPYSTRPDPANPQSYIRNPFPGNQIPTSRFDPTMLAYAKLLLPQPNTSAASGNFIDTTPINRHQNQYSARLDEVINQSNSMFFRYTAMAQPSTTSGGFPGLLTERKVTANNYAFNYLHTFNSTTTLDVQFGHNFIGNNQLAHYTQGSSTELLAKVPFSQSFACGYASYGASPDCLVPGVSITGYTSGGESLSDNTPLSSVYQWNADFSKVLGKHLIQAGGIFQRDSFSLVSLGATVSFTSSQTASPTIANTGDAYASFLLGTPDSSSKRATVAPVNGQKMFGAYIQDQWKALPSLTINLGMRYDLMFWPRFGSSQNNSDAIGEVDFSNGTYILQRAVDSCSQLGKAPCIPGGLSSVPNVIVSPDGHLWRNSYDNWQPRIGFAYQVNQRSVVRGAVGLFFDEWAGIRQTVQGIGGDWPSVAQNSAQNQTPLTGIPTVTAESPLSGVTALPAANPFTQSQYYRDPNAKNPYSEQWNLGFQQQLNAKTTLDIDYVGSHSVRLPTGGGLYNVALTPGPGNAATVAARRPFPYITPTHYDRSNGGASYNGLEVRLSQAPSHGLQYIISYTWSKTMDLACDGFFGVEGCSEQDPYHLQRDWSVAGYDLPQNLSISATYELPIGKGRALNVNNKVLNAVIAGWQVNGIYANTSGLPYNLTISGDIANTGNSGYRLNRVGNPQLTRPTRSQWFNTSAFTAPAQYTFGTEGRNDLRADGFQNLDASVFKNFPLERFGQLQFRAEAFNALNHLTYGTPGTNISTTSTFGTVSSERSTERIMQLAVKLLF